MLQKTIEHRENKTHDHYNSLIAIVSKDLSLDDDLGSLKG